MTIKVYRVSDTSSVKHLSPVIEFTENVGAEVAEKAIKGKSLSHRTA